MGDVKEYQNFVTGRLRKIFGEDNVKKEWDVAKDSIDAFNRELYCPRLDVAVGPFNIDGHVRRNNNEIKQVLQMREDFIRRIFDHSQQRTNSFERFFANRSVNPRCLLAIEIENSGSSKHMLGNVANVSILGSIGIVVPFNEQKTSLCGRIIRYVSFAAEVEKISRVFTNVLIVSKEDFLRALGNT